MFLETVVVSLAYVMAFFATFKFFMPIQDIFFPGLHSHASLLFLPHGVRVLSAWLLGWRSVVALLPGVFVAYLVVAGMGTFEPSRLIGILVAITVPAAVFQAVEFFNWNLSAQSDKTPCWPCIMAVGVLISGASSFLTNLALGSAPPDYFAYLIGDVFGLFFLMLILMYGFRIHRARTGRR